MESDDERGVLGSIPGAWVFDELDLDLSLPHFTTPCPSPAGFLLSPARRASAPPPVASPPPRSPAKPVVPSKSSMSNLSRVVRFHRRLSHSLFASSDQINKSATDGGSKLAKAAKVPLDFTPLTVPSLLDGSSATTSPSPLTKDLPPILPPLQFPSSLPGDALSLSSRVTRLSFDHSIPSFSPDSHFDSVSTPRSVLDPGWDFSSPVYDHAQLPRSRTSSNSSIMDPFPSTASLKPIPTIPSLSSDLHLNNLPIYSPSTPVIESHSYTHSAGGDVQMSSFFETLPVISSAPSTDSFVGDFLPTAQQAHHDMIMMSNPPTSRRRARIIVRDELFHGSGNPQSKEPWKYACQGLPYEAGLRPDVYANHSGASFSGKKILGPRLGNEGAIGDDRRKEETRRSPPKMMKKFMKRSSISRFLDFRSARQKISHPVFEKENVSQPVLQNQVENHPTSAGPRKNSSPALPCTPTDDTAQKTQTTLKPAARSGKRFSLPRPLSLFVVPKPKVTLADIAAAEARFRGVCPLGESFEVISKPRPSANPNVEKRRDAPAVTSSMLSPAEKEDGAKNRRRRSWFNLTSPAIRTSPRRFSR